MQELWNNGRWVDLALGFTLVEVLLLGLWVRITGRQAWFRAYLLNLGSGLCLMFALRTSLNDSSWQMPALWLALSGVLHGADLWLRWRQRDQLGQVRHS
jgi:phosphoglycerol transferase MdoB-like AlkP superfamily enzyme